MTNVRVLTSGLRWLSSLPVHSCLLYDIIPLPPSWVLFMPRAKLTLPYSQCGSSMLCAKPSPVDALHPASSSNLWDAHLSFSPSTYLPLCLEISLSPFSIWPPYLTLSLSLSLSLSVSLSLGSHTHTHTLSSLHQRRARSGAVLTHATLLQKASAGG